MFQLKKSVASLGLGVALMVGAVSSVQALAIEGRFNMGLGGVTISLGEVDWSAANPGNQAGKTYGTYLVPSGAGTRTGVFSDPSFNVFPGTLGTIQDLSQNPLDANFVPLGTSAPKVDFFTLSVQPTWQFNLDTLTPGSLAGSPFSVTESGGNVSVTLTASGYACDNGAGAVCDLLTDPETTRWTGVWSAQYTNTTVAALSNLILAGGTLPENTWSATVEAARISEPGSLALVGLALAAVGGIARRRAGKQAV